MHLNDPRASLPLLLAAPLLVAGCRSAAPSDPQPPPRAAAPGPDAAREPTQPAPQPAPATPDDIVLARVNGVPLTLRDAMDSFEDSHGGHSVLMRGEPAVRELAGRIIERQLFYAEAQALGLDRDPLLLDAAEERRQTLAEKLYWRRAVDEVVEVPDAEVEAYYEKSEVMLAVTLLETEDRAHCEALRERVLAGASIAELAAGESIHSSRNSGGLLPFVQRGDLEPALDQALFAMEEQGGLTPVLPTERGWAFARLDQRTINENRPPREVMLPQIRKVLADRAGKALREEVRQRIRAEAQVEVDPQLARLDVVLDRRGDPERVVARGDGQELTVGELQDYLDIDKLRAAPRDTATEALEAVVTEWTDRKAVRKAAREMGLFEDPEIQPPVERWSREATLTLLYKRFVYADIAPTDADVKAWFEQHAEEYTLPAEARVAYLIVPTREEAEAVLVRLEAGATFADVARDVSTDESARAHGGRIGWVKQGELLEEVEAEIFGVEPGRVIGPIETEAGFFVVDLMEAKPRLPVPFELAAPRARRALERELRLKAYDSWVARLRERADVEVREAGVRAAVAWLEEENARREAEKALQPQGDPRHHAPTLPGAPPPAGASTSEQEGS